MKFIGLYALPKWPCHKPSTRQPRNLFTNELLGRERQKKGSIKLQAGMVTSPRPFVDILSFGAYVLGGKNRWTKGETKAVIKGIRKSWGLG